MKNLLGATRGRGPFVTAKCAIIVPFVKEFPGSQWDEIYQLVYQTLKFDYFKEFKK